MRDPQDQASGGVAYARAKAGCWKDKMPRNLRMSLICLLVMRYNKKRNLIHAVQVSNCILSNRGNWRVLYVSISKRCQQSKPLCSGTVYQQLEWTKAIFCRKKCKSPVILRRVRGAGKYMTGFRRYHLGGVHMIEETWNYGTGCTSGSRHMTDA